MKIDLFVKPRAFPSDEARRALAPDGQFAALVSHQVTWLELDSDDPRVDRMIELTKDTPGLMLQSTMSFTEGEMAQARYFQLVCRSTVSMRDREADEYNARHRARLEALPFHRARGRLLRIKLLDTIELSRVTVKPNVVAGVGEWGDEYIVGRAVAKAFEQAELTGYELRPIPNPKTGKVHPDHFHLYCESIMPPAEMDSTTLPPNLGPDRLTRRESPRQLGCLTYRLNGAERLCDFNRTTEDWFGEALPTWVVTARVRECFLRHRLKGWEFRPVLEAGTAMHRQYLALWEDLLRRVAVNPGNRF